MTTEYERGFADAIRMASEVCLKMQNDVDDMHCGKWGTHGDTQISGHKFSKAILALRPCEHQFITTFGGDYCAKCNEPAPSNASPEPDWDSDDTRCGGKDCDGKCCVKVPEPVESEPVACVNDDKWNCKYCRKTSTCEALNDPRNFGHSVTDEEYERHMKHTNMELRPEPDWDSEDTRCGGKDCDGKCCVKVKEPVESEPVAWMLTYKNGKTSVIDRAPDSYEIRECKIDPLYLSKPIRSEGSIADAIEGAFVSVDISTDENPDARIFGTVCEVMLPSCGADELTILVIPDVEYNPIPTPNAESERDAARYRWLREHSTQPVEPWSSHRNPESLDAAIDAAMGKEQS